MVNINKLEFLSAEVDFSYYTYGLYLLNGLTDFIHDTYSY